MNEPFFVNEVPDTKTKWQTKPWKHDNLPCRISCTCEAQNTETNWQTKPWKQNTFTDKLFSVYKMQKLKSSKKVCCCRRVCSEPAEKE